MVKYKTLNNGLRIIVNENNCFKSVCVGIMVGAGSSNETAKQNGISHFIEHVNFKGTKKRTSFQISDEIDSMGAQMNAFTSKDITCYYVKCISEHIGECFEILSDLFLNSVYDSDELDKERGVILEEINMTQDTPDELCIDLLANSYFGNLGYGATILGSSENVNAFTKDDILDYKSKYYLTNNTVISFSGNITLEQAEKLVDVYFKDYQIGSVNDKNVNTNCLCNNLSCDKKIEQVHIALAMPSIKLDDEKRNIMLCLNYVLGGGMSSRLFQTVREQLGLAYNIYSYNSIYKETGVIYIYAGVNSENIEKAYNAIKQEIVALGEKGISQSELDRAKEQIKGSTILSQESNSSLMMSYGKRLLISNEVFDIDKQLEYINALKLEQVNEVAKRYFKLDKFATAIVGDNVKPLN